jgi:hypothetical protein
MEEVSTEIKWRLLLTKKVSFFASGNVDCTQYERHFRALLSRSIDIAGGLATVAATESTAGSELVVAVAPTGTRVRPRVSDAMIESKRFMSFLLTELGLG